MEVEGWGEGGGRMRLGVRRRRRVIVVGGGPILFLSIEKQSNVFFSFRTVARDCKVGATAKNTFCYFGLAVTEVVLACTLTAERDIRGALMCWMSINETFITLLDLDGILKKYSIRGDVKFVDTDPFI